MLERPLKRKKAYIYVQLMTIFLAVVTPYLDLRLNSRVDNLFQLILSPCLLIMTFHLFRSMNKKSKMSRFTIKKHYDVLYAWITILSGIAIIAYCLINVSHNDTNWLYLLNYFLLGLVLFAIGFRQKDGAIVFINKSKESIEIEGYVDEINGKTTEILFDKNRVCITNQEGETIRIGEVNVSNKLAQDFRIWIDKSEFQKKFNITLIDKN